MFYLVSNKSPKAIPIIEERLRDGRFRINEVGQDQRHEMILAALSSHPHACHILRENPDAIFAEELCSNPSQEGLLLLREYARESTVWPIIASNPAIGEYECENLRRILSSRVRKDGRRSIQSGIIEGLAKNPAPEAMRLFFEHFSDDDWDHIHYLIASNPAPEAIAVLEIHLEIHLEKLIHFRISRNEAAVHILEAHPELIDLEMLCYNPCAVHLVEERLDEMTPTAWLHLCMNPSHAALDLLAQHPDKITWNYLSMNPMIFEDWDFANGGLYILK
jgi:hypothetical protein